MSTDRSRREAMDLIVQEIARNDDENVSAAVRAALERGYSGSFLESLTEARRKKEGEIDRICARHYNDFLSSVAEMLRMRGSASALTLLVGQVHHDFGSAGEDLIVLLSELEVLQSEGEQTEKVLECLLRCKEVASLMVQIRQQINSQDHYVAMCTIERLYAQQTALPPLPRPLTLCLDRWLPAIIEQLLRATSVESDELLKSLRAKCLVIGQAVLRKQALISADALDGAGDYEKIPPASAASALFQELSESSSFAVQLLRRCAAPLRLGEWATRSDIELCATPAAHQQQQQQQHQHHYDHRDHDDDDDYSSTASGLNSLVESLPGSLGQLHKALHVAAILNQLPSLHDHMRNERWAFLTETIDEAEKQLQQLQQHHNNDKDGGSQVMDLLSPLLCKIAGFFVLECLVRRCVERPEGIYSWPEITGLWDKVCIRLDVVLAKQSDALKTPEQVLRIKDELAILQEAVGDEALGLRPIGIQETIRLLWGKFEELQVEAVQKSARAVLAQSTYEPITAEAESTMDALIKAHRLVSLELDIPAQHDGDDGGQANLETLETEIGLGGAANAAAAAAAAAGQVLDIGGSGGGGTGNTSPSSPRRAYYPFSTFVPHIQHALFMTVTRIVAFTAKSSLTVNRCDVACSAILRVYEGVATVMGEELSSDGGNTPLVKVCQISIDAAAIAAASDSVWQMLTNCQRALRWNQGRDGHLASCTASAKGALMQVSMTAQDVIVELLGHKVTELLGSIVFIDYLPEVHPRLTDTHESIGEIIDFLQITFQGLSYLPRAARDVAYFTCCNGVAQGLLSHLLSPKVPAVNAICLANIDIDCRELGRFAMTTGVPGLNQCFAELHEIVLLATHPDLAKYIDDPNIRRRNFPRLSIEKFVVLLEKIVPAPAGVNTANLFRFDKNSAKQFTKKLKQQGY